MIRMKYLLKKLHIGGGGAATGGSGFDDIRNAPGLPPLRPSSSSSAKTVGSTSSVTTGATASSSSRGRVAGDAAGGSRSRGMEAPDSLDSVPSLGGGRGAAVDGGSAVAVVPPKPPEDFSLFEEEYLVQLALAISVSDPDGREDPESAQINAAKQISLGCTPVASSGIGSSENLAEILSQRYWNFNILNYDEKVMDGFYDVYGIIHSSLQGKLPLLVDLQSASISENVDYEVVLVNRTTDHALQQLERQAISISKQCRAKEPGSHFAVIQKLADLVADTMGGPVCDADDMLRRWTSKSYELRSSLNTIVLPLGCLEVGLSRHRALLFKVLADQIDLPCKLVKGSYYTGTDEGAVNLIKMDHEREFIIDLMGAPGVLIPAEIPSCHLQNAEFDLVNSSCITQTVKDLSVALDSNTNWQLNGSMDQLGRTSNDPILGSESVALVSEENTRKKSSSTRDDLTIEQGNEAEKFEHDFGQFLPSSTKTLSTTCGINEPKTPFQMKVSDVSKYVVSAAKDPEFAQKLQAVLLESGASPPPDLFSCISSFDDVGGQNDPIQAWEIKDESNFHREMLTHVEHSLPFSESGHSGHGSESNCGASGMSNTLGASGVNEDKISAFAASSSSDAMKSKGNQIHDTGDFSLIESVNAISGASQMDAGRIFKDEERKAVLDDVAECEIPWEDLRIGERIGIGSYGEAYHADWYGTEVAVKKFLDQDLSGDALEQFRCEVKIMLRLRHPNVVLFMGAVTRPPNLSILTEFLPRGSLYRLLHRPKSQIDEKRRLKMALDVAIGMNYLHTSHPTIVHRDLKSPNLLVDKNWVVKISDFGLSRLKHHTFLSSKSNAGTPEWMAPEVLRNERSNEKCDVYSFGVILWELATLRVPWNGMNPMQVVGAVGFQNRRLDIPKEVDPLVAEIICNCWHNEPNQRPSFAQLMSPLRQLQRLIVEDP